MSASIPSAGSRSTASAASTEPPTSGRLATCKNCDKTEVMGDIFKRCARCRDVFYCSRECQRIDWTQHKLVCVSKAGAGAAAATATTTEATAGAAAGVAGAGSAAGAASVSADAKENEAASGETKKGRYKRVKTYKTETISHAGLSVRFRVQFEWVDTSRTEVRVQAKELNDSILNWFQSVKVKKSIAGKVWFHIKDPALPGGVHEEYIMNMKPIFLSQPVSESTSDSDHHASQTVSVSLPGRMIKFQATTNQEITFKKILEQIGSVDLFIGKVKTLNEWLNCPRIILLDILGRLECDDGQVHNRKWTLRQIVKS